MTRGRGDRRPLPRRAPLFAPISRGALLLTIALGTLGVGCAVSLPTTSVLCARARAALGSGDALGLFSVARDVYRRHGAEFDTSLTLEVMGPDTLSSYYREDGNRIVLAAGARPDRWPGQLRALSAALRYAEADGFPAGLGTAPAARFVNVLVLLIAAHEQAHYLRAQYFNAPQDGDYFESERVANELGVAVLRHLAAADPVLAAEVETTRALLEGLVASAHPAVAAYPPPGDEARAWFNRHYALLLRHEPGVYLGFQMRWWLEFLRAPPRALGPLLEERVLRAATSFLAEVHPSRRLSVRVETTATEAPRLPSEVLAVGPRGQLLVDADGRLVVHEGAATRSYTAPTLPYGEGYRSSYATWPEGQRVYAFTWQAPETLVLHAIELDDARGVAQSRELGRVVLPHRALTLGHDPRGGLYALAAGPEALEVYRLEPERGRAELWRRIPRRPAGHRDGPVTEATFSVGGFTVLADGSLVFADPDAFALRRLDEGGRLTTLFGAQRGRRDGDGDTARAAQPSHLAAHGQGLYFLDSVGHRALVRDVQLTPRWRRP